MFELTTQKNNECLRVKRGGYRSTHPVWLVWQATEASEPKQWPRPLLTYGQQSRLESATKPKIKIFPAPALNTSVTVRNGDN